MTIWQKFSTYCGGEQVLNNESRVVFFEDRVFPRGHNFSLFTLMVGSPNTYTFLLSNKSSSATAEVFSLFSQTTYSWDHLVSFCSSNVQSNDHKKTFRTIMILIETLMTLLRTHMSLVKNFKFWVYNPSFLVTYLNTIKIYGEYLQM